MPLSNAQIAAVLGQLAELLASKRANRFKIKAYRTAANVLRAYPIRLSDVIARGESLPKIPGVGASIASAVEEIIQSGTLKSVETLGEKLPPGSAALAEAARISLADAQRLSKKLGITTPDELREKLTSGELGKALGARLEFKIRHGLADVRRLLWKQANEIAHTVESALREVRGVMDVAAAGSLRRGKDTVGTLRFVVAARTSTAIVTMLDAHGGVESIEQQRPDRFVCKLAAGPLLIVRVTGKASWGTALVEETGSEEHLAEVAQSAQRKALVISATEEDWYASYGLPWIPPELREGRGETRAAQKGQLPSLIEVSDMRGDLHTHTTASDGVNTMEEMVEGARDRDYEYIAICDHSKSLKITNGLNEERLRQQIKEIDVLNASLQGFRVLKGSEVDILEDGALDFDDTMLRKLDVVMASVHSRFGLDKAAQSKRLLRAIKNPYVTCIGHLTGRMLLRRPGYELDFERILEAVKAEGKLLEINANAVRLDIDDALAKQARDLGIPLLINTDAHSIREYGYMNYGVQQARRGWQTTDTVLNTLPINKLLKRLAAIRIRKL